MKTTAQALVGAMVWIVFVSVTRPELREGAWVHALLLLLALVLVPLVLDLVAEPNETGWPVKMWGWIRVLQLPAALLLVLACVSPAGAAAALAAAPWVAICGSWAVAAGWRATRGVPHRSLDRLCGDIAGIFIGIGGAWVLADRADFQPLGFSRAIVELTAVHFHFAGLLLPLFAGLTVRRLGGSRLAPTAAVAAVFGVPGVAVGITATQLGWGPLVECVMGDFLALAGMTVALLHLRIAAISEGPPLTRALFGVAGLSLLFGMLLAGLYALRLSSVAVPWLDLSWMRALHGTANALGFGLCGTLAWWRAQRGWSRAAA